LRKNEDGETSVREGIAQYEPLWGEWYIGDLIGRGSYGEVYGIYREENGQRVEAAVKYISIPKSEQDKELAYSRGLAVDEQSLREFFETRANVFSTEAELMMKMQNSQNVVRYEAHMKQEKPSDIGWDILIRMERLKALDKHLLRNEFTQHEVVQMGIDICNAIADCQKEKIIHRDVKIENIFIDEVNGRFKLGDFGVSKEAKGTTMGTLTGTEDYMAPEITKRQKYNNNVDIYAIGIVMYRLLNNQRIPFLPAEGMITDEDVTKAVDSRINGNSEMPPPKYADKELAAIILKACAYDRKSRYTSPVEMASELEWILSTLSKRVVLRPRARIADVSGSGNSKDLAEDKRGMTDGGFIFAAMPGNAEKNAASASSHNTTIDPIELQEGTLSEVAAGLDMGAVSEVVGNQVPSKGTISDVPVTDASKTITEVPDRMPEDESKKKKKTGLWIGLTAVLCAVAGFVVFQMTSAIPVTSIENLSAPLNLVVGDEHQLELDVNPQNANERLTYESSDNKIVAIGEDNRLIALAAGTADIILIGQNVTESLAVVVAEQKVDVTDIGGVPESAKITIGSNMPMQCVVVPQNASEQAIQYSSSATDIAEISSDGVIIAKGVGTATIYVEADGVKKTMELTVERVPVESIVGMQSSMELTVGSSATLICSVLPENATVRTITYMSDNSAVATVDVNGVVTAHSPGTANISAAADGTIVTMVLTVKVVPVVTPTPRPVVQQTPRPTVVPNPVPSPATTPVSVPTQYVDGDPDAWI